MLTYKSLHDRAVVSFTGEVDWPSVCDLADLVDALVERHFHTRVELVIASPGGLVAALDHYVECAGQWRAKGVRLRTRVVSHAFSAAAVMLSLGDERVAGRGARLLYHPARVTDAGPVTARASTEIHDALSRVDEAMVERLVERVLAGGRCAVRVPYGAEPSDRRVLDALASCLSGGAEARAPRGLAVLAQRVGRAVTRAVKAGDREILAQLYRRLAEPERTISARLALTLRLVDRVGEDEAPAPDAQAGGAGLAVPQWRALYPPHGRVPRALLTRHTLVLGETGSGKSASAVLPVCAAMAKAPPDRLGAALVIDPKREAGAVLGALAPGRLRHVTGRGTVLNLMAGPAWSLESDLGAGRWLAAARRVLLRVHSLVPTTPARVLGEHRISDGNQEFFDREGTELLLTVVAFVLMVTDARAPSPESWLDAERDAEVVAWVGALGERARGGVNLLALAAWALTGTLTAVAVEGATVTLPPEEDDRAGGWLFARAARRARTVWGAAPGEGRDVLDRVVEYWGPMSRIDRQYAGVLATARTVCGEFADASVSRRLYFGCEPGYAAAREAGEVLDFARAVSREGGGPLVLYQPALHGPDALVAKALKAGFFEAVLHDPDRLRGGEDLPLVGYVADEFHRFVTSDRVHGEQSFLDTCRSFGAFCVLACQSMAGIEHALAEGAGSDARNQAAVSILVANTATKLVFRSTDPKTIEPLHALCPHHPGIAPVTLVRPLTTLAPGECYALLPDGRFERRRLEPFEARGRARGGRRSAARA